MNQSNLMDSINSRLNERILYFNYWTDHCVKYLLFVNAGGVIAVLGFMNRLKLSSAIFFAVLALVFFTIGLILVGVLLNHMRAFFYNLWLNLKADREKIFSREIADPQEVLDNDNQRATESKFAEKVARISSVCFLCGIIFGFISFFIFLCMSDLTHSQTIDDMLYLVGVVLLVIAGVVLWKILKS